MRREIEARVDELLLEQGEYVPMELLLQEARLDYAEYEAWRNGDIDCLDEVLFGDPQQVRALLRTAADYLKQRGWQPLDLNYTPWGAGGAGHASIALRFSKTAELNALFHTSYRRPEDLPQMDLFTDSPANTLCNGIIQSVLDKDIATARRRLDQLTDTAPDDIRLGHLEVLADALEEVKQPVGDVAQALARLQQTLTPIAERLLGTAASRQYLVPHWRRLSRALQNTPFSEETPELHRSYTATRALDWQAVRDAVEGEQHWAAHPVLLCRHARACEMQRDPAAWWSWFILVWHHPDHADALDESNPELRGLWEAFQNIDPELPVASFPSWVLLQRPGLAHHRADELLPDTIELPCGFATLLALLRLRLGEGDGGRREMELRARLKEQDPGIFECFLLSVRK